MLVKNLLILAKKINKIKNDQLIILFFNNFKLIYLYFILYLLNIFKSRDKEFINFSKLSFL